MGVTGTRHVRVSFSRTAVLVIGIYLFFVSGASTAQEGTGSHHADRGFRNVYLKEDHGFSDFIQWRWERMWKEIPSADSYRFPLAKNDPAFLRSNRNHTTLTWIGHATLLLQMHGENVLTDPQFSERASPVQWAGPKRVVPPGISMEDLPDIDIVIISHDHYDSLDVNTLRRLYSRPGGDKTMFYVPLGLREWFQKLGINNVVEMDWWEEREREGLRIIAVPMQHWGKRSPFSRNDHLWASWVLIADDFRFYFGGDTGYSPHFRETGDRFGPFDLALLPIGAYEPRWFMKDHHINPEEAVQAHIDLRSNLSVAMHWGTFMLTDEPLDEPPVRLMKAMEENDIADNAFLVLQHGETIILD